MTFTPRSGDAGRVEPVTLWRCVGSPPEGCWWVEGCVSEPDERHEEYRALPAAEFDALLAELRSLRARAAAPPEGDADADFATYIRMFPAQDRSAVRDAYVAGWNQHAGRVEYGMAAAPPPSERGDA